MKITFLIPPVLDGTKPAERVSGCTHVVYPVPNIYELTVAAVLEREGHDVRCRDFVLEGKSERDFISFLSNDDSEIYSVWTVSLSIANDLLARDIIRKERPGSYVMFLGPSPTYEAERFIECGRTVVIRGEPEETAAELVRAISGNRAAKGDVSTDIDAIQGVSYFYGGKTVHNPGRRLIKDLDSLPFPARHLLGKYAYRNPKLKKSPYTAAVTSRNCPHKCIYCVPGSLSFARELEHKKDHSGCKPPVSARSVANVTAELDLLAKSGYKAVGFLDDNFIHNGERTAGICEALRESGFVWGCQTRADSITGNIARELGRSGCAYVDIGVESFDDNVLKYIKKGMTSEQIYAAVRLLKENNVPVKLNILLGIDPHETKKSLEKTYRQVGKLRVDQVMFNIASPFPGTEFYDLAVRNKWLAYECYMPADVQRKAIISYPGMNSRQLEKTLFRWNLRFFLDPRFILRNVVRFGGMNDFLHALKAVKMKLFG